MSETFYTPKHISGAMSLRKPQIESLNVLDKILSSINSSQSLEEKLETVNPFAFSRVKGYT